MSVLSIRAAETAPAKSCVTTTANDTTVHLYVRGVWVNTGGSVVISDQLGVDSTWIVPDGTLIPVAATKIKATGTTASGFILLK
jgi:hypothetical protein